jgi:hypothetical protein
MGLLQSGVLERRRLVAELMRRKCRSMLLLLVMLLGLEAEGVLVLKVVVQSVWIETMEMAGRRRLTSMESAF